jgi:AcrR family transcriptional regulator
VGYERPADQDLSLRERKKVQTKRRVQETALRLLESTSYEALTVEDIAAESDVSPSTVYRHFLTKEGIFLWDEYDNAIMARFSDLLSDHGPVEAMSQAVSLVLTSQFDLDRERSLAQLQLIESIEPLRHELTVRLDELRRVLAAMVVEHGWPPLRANVFAGAIVSSFWSVIEVWLAEGGRDSLPDMLEEAMGLLSTGFNAASC